MDEIKKLKMMLEGKAPIDSSALTALSQGGSEPNTIIQERIVYGQAKEGSSELEQELRNKEDQLRSEQEEK